MYQSIPSYKRPIAALIGVLCLGLSLGAQASVVSTLSVAALSSANGGVPIPNMDGPSSDSAYTSVWSGVSNQNNAWAFGRNYSAGSTSYAAGANGEGVFTSQASFKKSVTIVNDSSFAQSYSLAYYIYAGSLSVGGTLLGDYGTASVSYNIFEGISQLLGRYASIAQLAGGGYSGTYSGFVSATNSGSNFHADAESGSIDLGILGAGQSKTITYELISTVTGNYADNTGTCDGYGYGGYGYGDGYGDFGTTVCSYTGRSYAFLGDPDGIDATNPQLMTITSNAVPLPGSLSLLGIGLAGLGFSRRRRADN